MERVLKFDGRDGSVFKRNSNWHHIRFSDCHFRNADTARSWAKSKRCKTASISIDSVEITEKNAWLSNYSASAISYIISDVPKQGTNHGNVRKSSITTCSTPQLSLGALLASKQMLKKIRVRTHSKCNLGRTASANKKSKLTAGCSRPSAICWLGIYGSRAWWAW